MPLRITKTANEGSTAKMTFQLLDYDDDGVDTANITSATFTLTDRRTGKIINSNDGLSGPSSNVIANFDSSGNFDYTLLVADNVIMSPNRKRRPQQFEEHIFTITVVSTVGGGLTLNESISIMVADLLYKP